MLWKLSLTGIKGRLRDYLVLFSGLVMASAIFYMFEAMASNEAFLKSNSMISSVVFIFRFGSVLLGIITFVYILYANSFLMAMRQKDYAMFMMLGAKSWKIAQMIFIETFMVGILATVTGALAGIGLTSVVNTLLVQQLNVKITHFSPFNSTGLLVTLVFFTVLFLIAAIVNASSIVKKTILALLKESQTPVRLKQRYPVLFGETVVGVILLAIGYYMMSDLMMFQLPGIGVALVTIVTGTYFIFHSVIIFILMLLKKSDSIALKKLNNFTLSQLSFRIRDYTQMLSMVSILFALALGALTVGLGFKNEIPKMADASSSYDLVLNNAQNVEQQQVAQLNPTLNTTYDQKEDEQNIYYVREQFEQQPLIVPDSSSFMEKETVYKKITAEELGADIAAQDELRNFELPEQKEKNIQLVSLADFEQLPLAESKLQLVQVKSFEEQLPAIKELAELNNTNNPSWGDGSFNTAQKYFSYDVFNTMFSGFEFMGFFLGIAFLTMLASCLMFKILSGANSDVIRYTMLDKIGARTGLLKKSIRKEIGVLFLVPGVLGMVHVLFGLKMFSTLMRDPYNQIWIPFSIFIGFYLVYYFLTIWLYTAIVIEKKEN